MYYPKINLEDKKVILKLINRKYYILINTNSIVDFLKKIIYEKKKYLLVVLE